MEDIHTTARPDDATIEVVEGGSMLEAIGGIGGIVLAILGLAGILPFYMVAIGTMAVGVGLLVEGGALSARFSRLIEETAPERPERAAMGEGMSFELLGGLAGAVLGLLALLGVNATTLTAVAVIVLGAALLFGSGATSRLNHLVMVRSGLSKIAQDVTHESISTAAGAQVIIGLGSIVLGILALLGLSPRDLVLVAILALGASILLSGTAITSRMMSLSRRRY